MTKPSRPTAGDERSGLSRRTLFAGASTVGALAAAATLIPRAPADASAAVESKPAPTKGGGYSLSDHVKQYYQTTRI
ncbi:MAG: formate dehydrogenase [Hydrogenophaga sp.]|uniref:formate dehydrogenase n=1 Tax=Hydrogenophaga sp. TaxID=1904254 RepID=UPI002603095F|nr:formate dehydrogenase [Hydrogenophaga sp.]MDM7941213.1 formate dehydrogenase [Hydrogenophaga sp.]